MSDQQAQIELRPLGEHSCTDLGFSLARQWYWSLVSLYLLVFSPVLLIALALVYLEPEYASAVQIALWWLKPLGELGLLYWCSQSLFGAKPGFKSAFFSTYKSLPRLLINYLSLFRFSPTRDFSMCVVFLEKTRIRKGKRRLDVLSGSGGALTWLFVVGANIEFVLALGMYLMMNYLIPFDTSLTESFASNRGVISWLDALDNNSYLLCGFAAQVIFAPFFVCASFVHYINRRSRLEAWDIQQRFISLNDRVQNEAPPSVSAKVRSITACLIACLCVFTFSPQQAVASSAADEASDVISNILQQDRFGHYSENGRLRERESEEEEQSSKYDFSMLESVFEFLGGEIFTTFLKWLVFALIAFAAFYSVRKLYPKVFTLKAILALPRRAKTLPTEHDLVVAPASFIEARQLMLGGETRAALACLLRSVIAAAREQDGLEIPQSFTESECQQVVDSQLNAESKKAFTALLSLWRKQAYEGKTVSSLYADQVVKDCEIAFSPRQS